MARVLLAAVMMGVVVVGAPVMKEAHGQGLVTSQKLSADLANELVGEAVANCAQKGYAVTAVVVDLEGVRQAMLRGNGAPIHTLDSAFYKAYSAASLTLTLKEDSTTAVAERMNKGPRTVIPPTQLPNVTFYPGGVTIRAGGSTAIGAIGVGGSVDSDEECARSALAKIKDRIK
jgi:uncharacterized protein GlcG (DUF336 family)